MKITIDESNTNGKKEIYDFIYNCPNCNYSELLNYFHFCPKCGQEIEWTGEEPDD